MASCSSLQMTTDESQKSLPLASSIASSIVLYCITDATGPNISSLKLETLGVTSARTVGAKKYHFPSSFFHPVTSLAPVAIALATCVSISRIAF